MPKNILYVGGLGVAVLCIIVFAVMLSPSGDDAELSVPTPTPVTTPTETTATEGTPAPEVELTSVDYEFMEWATQTVNNFNEYLEEGEKAGKRFKYDEAEEYSQKLYDDAVKALTEIDQYETSEALQPAKDEFKLALEDYKQVGQLGVQLIQTLDMGLMDTVTSYRESAEGHVDNYNNLLP